MAHYYNSRSTVPIATGNSTNDGDTTRLHQSMLRRQELLDRLHARDQELGDELAHWRQLQARRHTISYPNMAPLNTTDDIRLYDERKRFFDNASSGLYHRTNKGSTGRMDTAGVTASPLPVEAWQPMIQPHPSQHGLRDNKVQRKINEVNDESVAFSSAPITSATAAEPVASYDVTEHKSRPVRQPIAAMIPVEVESDARTLPSTQRPHVTDQLAVQVETGPAGPAFSPFITSKPSASILPPVPIAHSLVHSTTDSSKSSLVEMLMMQNAQMHQLCMHQMMLLSTSRASAADSSSTVSENRINGRSVEMEQLLKLLAIMPSTTIHHHYETLPLHRLPNALPPISA